MPFGGDKKLSKVAIVLTGTADLPEAKVHCDYFLSRAFAVKLTDKIEYVVTCPLSCRAHVGCIAGAFSCSYSVGDSTSKEEWRRLSLWKQSM